MPNPWSKSQSQRKSTYVAVANLQGGWMPNDPSATTSRTESLAFQQVSELDKLWKTRLTKKTQTGTRWFALRKGNVTSGDFGAEHHSMKAVV